MKGLRKVVFLSLVLLVATLVAGCQKNAGGGGEGKVKNTAHAFKHGLTKDFSFMKWLAQV
jgi:predicted small secreted protein